MIQKQVLEMELAFFVDNNLHYFAMCFIINFIMFVFQ